VPADRKPALDAAVLASLALFAEGMGSK
jgi:hypothetical protein